SRATSALVTPPTNPPETALACTLVACVDGAVGSPPLAWPHPRPLDPPSGGLDERSRHRAGRLVSRSERLRPAVVGRAAVDRVRDAARSAALRHRGAGT